MVPPGGSRPGTSAQAGEAARPSGPARPALLAEGPQSLDCSGLTSWACAEAGVTPPRASRRQATVGPSAPHDAIRAGDLVFGHPSMSHIAIAIAVDSETLTSAPQTGDVATCSPIPGREFAGAARL